MREKHWAVVLAAVVFVLSLAARGVAAEPGGEGTDDFLGTWHVTSATQSMILHIKPKGEALFILIEKGAHGIDNVTWKSAAGGIVVEGAPRLRLWKGRHREEVRAEMEPLPRELTSESLQQFPLAFFMSRVDAKRQFPKAWSERPLPAGWTEAALPADWDKKAGTRRPAPQ